MVEEIFNKTKIYFGQNSLERLREFQGKQCFLVADPFLEQNGMLEKIKGYLTAEKCDVYTNVKPDPSLELVVDGIRAMKLHSPEVVIAIGGGSAIDEAKAIKYFSEKIENRKGIQFVAIPTTSGTGSEMTSFAVITDMQKGLKYPLVANELQPDVAILDPNLVVSVPPAIVADTGIDVLTHALEAYVSKRANAFTDAWAQKAVLLVFRYLIRSYENVEDIEAKTMMHYASCLAGMAFNQTSLGVNHAIAHNLGGKFHIPHGRSNGILLPYVLEFNAGLTDYQQKEFSLAAKKYAHLSTLAGFGGIGVRGGVKSLIHQIQKIQKQMNMPLSLRECGINQNEYKRLEDELVNGSLKDACIETNPRNVGRSEILHILKQII